MADHPSGSGVRRIKAKKRKTKVKGLPETVHNSPMKSANLGDEPSLIESTDNVNVMNNNLVA